MSKHLRLARLIELMGVIKFHPEWGPKRLAEYFEISEKRLYDDLNELNAANIPIVYNGKGYSFLQPITLPPVQFTSEEALALLAGSSVLERQKDPAFAAASRGAVRKIIGRLPEEMRSALTALDNRLRADTPAAAETRSSLSTLNRAIMDRRSVRFDYYTYSRNRTGSREADPYGVIYRGNAWYLIAFCHNRGEVRTFRVNRIRGLAVSKNTFVYPENFSIHEYVADCWGVFQGEETDVVINFSPKLAPLIEEIEWRPDQKIERRPDGGITFSIRAKGLLEIRRWVLSWGEGVEVVRPPELREDVARHAAAIARANSRSRRPKGKI